MFSLKLVTSLEYTQNLFMNNKLIVCEMISDKLIYFESSFTSILSNRVGSRVGSHGLKRPWAIAPRVSFNWYITFYPCNVNKLFCIMHFFLLGSKYLKIPAFSYLSGPNSASECLAHSQTRTLFFLFSSPSGNLVL